MPIEFQHAPPVAALASLAQHAGAVDAHRKRRAELEAMNMKMLQMRKQEQQQGLDRVFNAWRTQYGEASALQRMKADQQFRDAQQEKAAAQQMKGWDIQQDGMNRRQEADNIAAMARQQDELRARGDAASIKAADEMYHDLFTAVGGTLNGNGKKAMWGLQKQMADMKASKKIPPDRKPEEIKKIAQQIFALREVALNTVVLPGEDGYRKDYDGYYTMVIGGQEHVKPIHDDKEGYAPYIRKVRELHGHGETQDHNGDGIPDTVTHVQFETDEFGTPRYKGNVDVKIDPGKEAETPRQKQESRSTWISGMIDTVRGIDPKLKVPVDNFQFSAGAPEDMIQAASELSPWATDAEGKRIPVSPTMRRSQLIAIANQYYQRMYHPGAPGAPQAPGAGSNRLDPDMKEELLKHFRPRQYTREEELADLQQGHIDKFGRPPSGDFQQPDFPPVPDREAAEGLMGPLDDAPVAKERAAAARQGLGQQSGAMKHRLLMEGQEEPARLIAEFESIDQNPNMPPEEKRVRREAILLQLKKLKADELRKSGMFGGGGR